MPNEHPRKSVYEREREFTPEEIERGKTTPPLASADPRRARRSSYKAWAVEIHVSTCEPNVSYVFPKEFSERFTAARCYNRMALTMGDPIVEIRLWNGGRCVAAFAHGVGEKSVAEREG